MATFPLWFSNANLRYREAQSAATYHEFSEHTKININKLLTGYISGADKVAKSFLFLIEIILELPVLRIYG